MMLFAYLLLLLLRVLPSWSSVPPLIDVGEELVIKVNERSSFSLHCKGSKPLHWKTTTGIIEDEAADLEITDTADDTADYPFASTFTVNDIFGGDTGYYYCYYNGATDFANDRENVDSTYVYVNGKQAFASHEVIHKQVPLSEALVIDCITTHPDINVILKHHDKDITRLAQWDPRIGFVRRNITVQDSGIYTCESPHHKDSVVTFVQINTNKELPKPSIHWGVNQHFVHGDGFTLECILIDHESVAFHWNYPNTAVKYTQNFEKETVNNNTYLKSTLLVPRASVADTGLYTCSVSSSGFIPNSVSEFIEIKENLTSFVNITSSEKISTTEGELVNWKADVLSYPSDPVIVYTDWGGLKLEQTERITIEYHASKAESWLMISNISSSDFGNYTVTATTSDGVSTDSTTTLLEVKSVPHMMMEGVPHYVAPEQSLHVTCTAQGFPLSAISVQFQSCPSGQESCSFSRTIQTAKEETYFPAPGNKVETAVNFSPRTSGLLSCIGQNDLGVHNTTAVIRVSDIGGIFVLRYIGREMITEVEDQMESISVVENDNFLLVCGGSKFEYKNVKLMHMSQLVLQADPSEFSWVTRKAAEKAAKTHAGNFACIAEPHGDEPAQVKRIAITVLDEERVHFEEESNMNKNQTVIVRENESFHLSCNVTGTPTPTVQWMKDNKTLTPTSEFFDEKAMAFSSDLKVLTLSFVFKKHVGVYTCTAENRLNKIMGSLTLRVPVPGLSTTAKVGLAIALVGIAILVMVVVFLVNRVKRERKLRKSLRANEIFLFEKGNICQLNPDCTADEQAELLPYDKKWEVLRKNITLGKQLGSGAFGRVVKATVTGLEGQEATTVAIKMCKSHSDASQMRALMLELKIMIHLGKHLNIVNLMGANTVHISTGELWILVEYCRFGNLLVFMQRHRRKFINQINPVTGKIDHYRTTLDPSSLMSPCLSESYPSVAAVDQDGYLAPITPKFVLSDPPMGHSTRTDPSSTTLMNNTSVPGRFLPQDPAGQYASNPVYGMGLNNPTRDIKETPEDSKDSGKSQSSQLRGSRLQSAGSAASSGIRSPSSPLRNVNSNMTTLMHSDSTASPLSPTDSYFLGEAGIDSKGNPSVPDVGSVPGVTASFSTNDLICWGWQVAQGMEYLSRRNVLHGDLAARNLLLADNNVVKISDFGLSRDMYKKDVYMKKGDDLMPVKWISTEAIRDRIFSVQSDVWAFGVTLWEIFSLGSTPYPGIELNNNFLQLLEDGHRMSCPKYANQEIYNVMMQCWAGEPMNRPSFSQLVDYLEVMMLPDVKGEYLSMNDTYKRMNEKRFKEETDYLNMLANPNFESMTKAEEYGPQYVNVLEQTRVQSPDTVAYSRVGSPSSPQVGSPSSHSSVCSPVESNYLPMDSAAESRSLSRDVTSSHTSELSRFAFSSSSLGNSTPAFHPEEKECTFAESEEPTENSTLINMREQSHSEGNLSSCNEDEVPVKGKDIADTSYINL
nr:receptor tyrosine kinase PVR2A1 [Gecarcinus lateralis]